MREQRVELVEPGLGVVLARKPRRPRHVADGRIERAVDVLRRAEVAHPHMRLARQPLEERRRQPRLADAGLAGDEHDLPFARFRLVPTPEQQFGLFLAAHERHEAARVQRLEPALLRTRAQRRPGAGRPGDALEVL
ncbi:MAG TPA: hypothetical protein VJY34_18025 [Roseiarcus sp.]|nr:hypothetical protein [Roseiarcus sp.]